MNLEELTRKAQDTFFRLYYSDPRVDDDTAWRAAVLAVLAEVRQCVPEPLTGPGQEFDTGNDGWNDCRAEMLRRLEEMTK